MGNGGGGLDWAGTKVPLWAAFLLVLSTGAVGLSGGNALWRDNNEPRFTLLQDQITQLRAVQADIFVRLDGKVDKKTREETVAEQTRRMDAIERFSAEQTRAVKDDLTRRLDGIERRLDQITDRLNNRDVAPYAPYQERK